MLFHLVLVPLVLEHKPVIWSCLYYTYICPLENAQVCGTYEEILLLYFIHSILYSRWNKEFFTIFPDTAKLDEVKPEAEDDNLINRDFFNWCDEDNEQVRFPDCWKYN